MTVKLDQQNHVYSKDGIELPSVTQVLSRAGLYDFSVVNKHDLEVARQKGVAVHKMIELFYADSLDEDGLPEWMVPIYVRWIGFLRESGFNAIESERMIYHPRYRYAGTLDLYGDIHGEYTLIDVKRSFFAGPVIGLQLAAYREAYAEENGAHHRKARRYALRLNEAGPYRLEEYDDNSDWAVFLALLTADNWKRKNLK